MLFDHHRVDARQVIKGHDYRRGIDVEKSRAGWQLEFGASTHTRRVGGDLLVYEKGTDGKSVLRFEVYDGGSLGRPQRHGGIKT